MDAQEIITEVSEQLNDTDMITWTESMLIGYINSAQKAIASVRPDASSLTTTHPLVAGTKQTLPATAIRLTEVTRNMGADGLTPGRTIRVADHDSLRLFDSSWHTAAQVAEIKNFAYNEKTPEIFYVDPPSDGTVQIEISYTIIPETIMDSNDILSLTDIYKNHVIQWVMFKAYSVEVDSHISIQRAASHWDQFWQMLGRKYQRDLQFSPSKEVAAGPSDGG